MAKINWTPERIALLGTMTDVKLAAKFGLTPAAIGHARKRNGIKPFVPQRKRLVFPAVAIKLMGRVTDREIGERFGISPTAVTKRRNELKILPTTATPIDRKPWSKAELKMFETHSDYEIAKLTGRGVWLVKAKKFDVGLAKRKGKKK